MMGKTLYARIINTHQWGMIDMKCSVKDCKNKAVYVWIDACLIKESKKEITIHRREIMCYPMCIDHDNKIHEKIPHWKSSDYMRRIIKIRR
jgi:hypothetical protein